jgi:hypothetical protein
MGNLTPRNVRRELDRRLRPDIYTHGRRFVDQVCVEVQVSRIIKDTTYELKKIIKGAMVHAFHRGTEKD